MVDGGDEDMSTGRRCSGEEYARYTTQIQKASSNLFRRRRQQTASVVFCMLNDINEARLVELDRRCRAAAPAVRQDTWRQRAYAVNSRALGGRRRLTTAACANDALIPLDDSIFTTGECNRRQARGCAFRAELRNAALCSPSYIYSSRPSW